MNSRKKIYYWINSSKEMIDLVDFFNNNDNFGRRSVYHVIDGALKCKDGQFFGKNNQKTILMTLSIKSEQDIQDLIEKKVFNPKLLIYREEIDLSELGKNLKEGVFKNGKMFEVNMDLFDYFKEISFKFDDNSIPLSPSRLNYWYIPIRSNMEYNRIRKTYDNKNLYDDMDYIIMDEEIKCKDGRVLSQNNKITICFEFITRYKKLCENLVNEGVIQKEDVYRAIIFKEDQIKTDYYFWKYKKNKQSFDNAKELADYLKEIGFKFEDNTIFNP